MRIPSGTTDQVIYFIALDSTDLKTRETGLTTFTVYRSRNGSAAAAMTTPTVTEVSLANMPGVYKLLLDEDMTIGSGNDSEEMIFHITQASMAPVDRVIELYRPKATVGQTIGVTGGAIDDVVLVATTTTNTDQRGTDSALLAASAPTNFGDMSISVTTGLVDITQTAADKPWSTAARTLTAATNITSDASAITMSSSGVVGTVNLTNTTTTNTDMRGTDSALLAASAPTNFGDLAITVTTGKVTVGTNDDKTGYSLTQSFPSNFADMSITLTTGLVDITQTAADKPWSTATRALTDKIGFAISGTITTLDGLQNLSASQVNTEVVDVLFNDTITLIGQTSPSNTPTIASAMGFVYKMRRNKQDQTATEWQLYDDAGTTVDQKATVSDDSTTATTEEVVSGP